MQRRRIRRRVGPAKLYRRERRAIDSRDLSDHQPTRDAKGETVGQRQERGQMPRADLDRYYAECVVGGLGAS